MLASALIYRGDGVNAVPSVSKAFDGSDQDAINATVAYFREKGLNDRADRLLNFLEDNKAEIKREQQLRNKKLQPIKASKPEKLPSPPWVRHAYEQQKIEQEIRRRHAQNRGDVFMNNPYTTS